MYPVDDPKQKMAKINKEWHLKNRMPKSATLDQRIEWHLQHSKNCNCREMSQRIAQEIKKLDDTKSRSAYEMALTAGIIGGVDAPPDLSTNPRHFRKFGKQH